MMITNQLFINCYRDSIIYCAIIFFMKYYRLLDKENRGIIVRGNDDTYEKYLDDRWIHTGLMALYFSVDHELYDLYEEISESEALLSTK